MPKVTNDIRITKYGKTRLETLLKSFIVNNYHKTILKGIFSRIPKKLSKADCEIFETISKQY